MAFIQIIHVFFSIFISGNHFVYQSRTILAALVEVHLSNIPLSLNEIGLGVWKEFAFKMLLFLLINVKMPTILTFINGKKFILN